MLDIKELTLEQHKNADRHKDRFSCEISTTLNLFDKRPHLGLPAWFKGFKL